jgi:Cu+-exporting ATPase
MAADPFIMRLAIVPGLTGDRRLQIARCPRSELHAEIDGESEGEGAAYHAGVTRIRTIGYWDEASLLAIVAAAETGSEHPLGAAIVTAARDRGLALPPVERFTAIPGRGIDATVAGRRVLVGNAALLTDAGTDVTALTPQAGQAAAAGQTPMFAAVAAEAAGLIVVADPVKPDSAGAVAS